MESSDRASSGSASEQATTFASLLSEFKRRGSLLLLAGPAQHTALATACRRLLGNPTERRRRLFVLAGTSAATHPGLRSLAGPEAEDARVVSCPTRTRSVAASAGAAGGPGASAAVPTEQVEGDLSDLLVAVTDAASAFDAAAGGLEPAELRICIDSLDVLMASYDEEAVFRFLHSLAGLAREHAAMAHVHLPADVDSRAVELVAPACDAIVEVRDADCPQQRWHVPDEDLTTDWLLF